MPIVAPAAPVLAWSGLRAAILAPSASCVRCVLRTLGAQPAPDVTRKWTCQVESSSRHLGHQSADQPVPGHARRGHCGVPNQRERASRSASAAVEIYVAFDGDDPELAAQAIDPIRRLGTVIDDDIALQPYADTLADGSPPPGPQFAVRSAFVD